MSKDPKPKVFPKPKRGEIWGVILDPVEGSEMGGHSVGGERPVVVLSARGIGRPSIRVCVPITSFQDIHALWRWCVILSPDETGNPVSGNPETDEQSAQGKAPTKTGLSRVSTVDTSQIRALDVSRFGRKWGSLGEREMQTILRALGAALGFELASEADANETPNGAD